MILFAFFDQMMQCNKMYTTSDFDYALPDELIAQTPLPERSGSRLLQLTPPAVYHRKFQDILSLLHPGDLLVRNNTRVIPARLFGKKSTGGKIECLLERILSKQRALVHLRSNHRIPLGLNIQFQQHWVTVVGKADGLFEIELLDLAQDLTDDTDILSLFLQQGLLPLPPYIARLPEADDLERYQTVFGTELGAVAAPTAGLHFDQLLLQQLQQKGIEMVDVTLHVGAGTFQPLRGENLQEQHLHQEWMCVDEAVCAAVMRCRARGGRVVAVGTTSVRCLETAAQSGELHPYTGPTELFIYPGFQFHCVDALITNFHLPRSSLLMLVCALAGYESVIHAYQTAVQQRYRFFSYGDAMFCEKSCG